MSIIKSLSVGNGDMFYIKHDTDNFSIIDCCMNKDNRENIVQELKDKSANKNIKRFISTHPDDDHIRGLKYLNNKMEIPNFYTVQNEATKEDETDDFKEYCNLRDSEKVFYLKKDCERRWMNLSSDERGNAGINILWPITDNEHYKEALKEAKEGGSPNNICPIIKYSLKNGVTALWMGDLETSFMKSIENNVTLEKVDILFAPHHGRKSGQVPDSWLKKNLKPKIIVIGEAPSEDLTYYQNYNTIKQNSSGDILFECVENKVHIYVENESYKEGFLSKEEDVENDYNLYYLGTIKTYS